MKVDVFVKLYYIKDMIESFSSLNHLSVTRHEMSPALINQAPDLSSLFEQNQRLRDENSRLKGVLTRNRIVLLKDMHQRIERFFKADKEIREMILFCFKGKKPTFEEFVQALQTALSPPRMESEDLSGFKIVETTLSRENLRQVLEDIQVLMNLEIPGGTIHEAYDIKFLTEDSNHHSRLYTLGKGILISGKALYYVYIESTRLLTFVGVAAVVVQSPLTQLVTHTLFYLIRTSIALSMTH